MSSCLPRKVWAWAFDSFWGGTGRKVVTSVMNSADIVRIIWTLDGDGEERLWPQLYINSDGIRIVWTPDGDRGQHQWWSTEDLEDGRSPICQCKHLRISHWLWGAVGVLCSGILKHCWNIMYADINFGNILVSKSQLIFHLEISCWQWAWGSMC